MQGFTFAKRNGAVKIVALLALGDYSERGATRTGLSIHLSVSLPTQTLGGAFAPPSLAHCASFA